jgi:hypothetical protein
MKEVNKKVSENTKKINDLQKEIDSLIKENQNLISGVTYFEEQFKLWYNSDTNKIALDYLDKKKLPLLSKEFEHLYYDNEISTDYVIYFPQHLEDAYNYVLNEHGNNDDLYEGGLTYSEYFYKEIIENKDYYRALLKEIMDNNLESSVCRYSF